MEPVTRPDKIVTDKTVLRQLVRQGIDYRYVEFTDYGKRGLGISPNMKGYKDLLSNRRWGVTSGLPMCNAQGQKIEPIWIPIKTVYSAPYNLFNTTVEKAQVILTCVADQPNGTKSGDQVIYRPQLFIGGSEVHPISDVARLLEVDPVNPNYLYNTLEWDYGVCKRRIRVIQGRFRERWIFSTNPNADVRIKHNLNGNLRLRLGSAIDADGLPLKVLVVGDEEIILASEFAEATYPVEIGASLTVYPDAHEETSSVDGFSYQEYAAESGVIWATIRGDDGSHSLDAEVYFQTYIKCDDVGRDGKYRGIQRPIILFDTSPLTGAASISAATLSTYGYWKANGLDCAINIYSSDPASNIGLVPGDYNSLGATAFSTEIAYADWNEAGYNAFVLNGSGIAAISKTGISKFGQRESNHDAPNSEPTWVAGAGNAIRSYAAEQGTGFKPKLVITYTLFIPKVAGIV